MGVSVDILLLTVLFFYSKTSISFISIHDRIIAFSFEAILICFSAAVAFQSRKIRQAFNESRVVGNMAYTFFLFLLFRALAFFLPSSLIQPSLKNGITSLLLTLESLVGMGLYFGTKFWRWVYDIIATTHFDYSILFFPT